MGDSTDNHHPRTIERICNDIKQAWDAGHEIGIVVGGGNIYRGVYAKPMGIDRVSGDYMGMLATAINALALQSKLESIGVDTRVQSTIPMTSICEMYIRRRAIRHMDKNRIVIFACGTGNPFFTTDAGAALKASEIDADVIVKCTQVDGVYDDDPKTNPSAKHYKTLTYREVINRDLKVMDTAAITLARDNQIPIVVFDVHNEGALLEVLNGKGKFTVINGKSSSPQKEVNPEVATIGKVADNFETDDK